MSQHHLTIEINNCIGRPCPNSSDCKLSPVRQPTSSSVRIAFIISWTPQLHNVDDTGCWPLLVDFEKNCPKHMLVVGDQYPHFFGSKNMLKHNIFAPSSYPNPMDVAQQQMLIFGSRNHGLLTHTGQTLLHVLFLLPQASLNGPFWFTHLLASFLGRPMILIPIHWTYLRRRWNKH